MIVPLPDAVPQPSTVFGIVIVYGDCEPLGGAVMTVKVTCVSLEVVVLPGRGPPTSVSIAEIVTVELEITVTMGVVLLMTVELEISVTMDVVLLMTMLVKLTVVTVTDELGLADVVVVVTKLVILLV